MSDEGESDDEMVASPPKEPGRSKSSYQRAECHSIHDGCMIFLGFDMIL